MNDVCAAFSAAIARPVAYNKAQSQTRSCQLELDFDGLFDCAHVDLGESAEPVLEPVLAHGRELAGHRLVLLLSQRQ